MNLYRNGLAYYNLDMITKMEIRTDCVVVWFTPNSFFKDDAIFLQKTDELMEKLGLKETKREPKTITGELKVRKK